MEMNLYAELWDALCGKIVWGYAAQPDFLENNFLHFKKQIFIKIGLKHD